MAVKKSAPAPPPSPPLAASSEETDSRSRSQVSDDEDAVAESTALAPKNTPAPPQDEEDVEESDEESTTKAANGQHEEARGFEEMRERYPYLAEEVMQLEAEKPGMFKRQFGKIDDDKARRMDDKIKRLRVAQMKFELRNQDLLREVTKAMIDLID